MDLTTEQAAALRADILASNDPDVVAARGGGAVGRNDTELARLYNLAASPAYTAWKVSITKDEIYGNGFSWAQIDNVTEPRWRIWVELFDNEARACAPYKPNVRAGIGEVWTGTAAKEAVRDYVLAKCKRAATRVERLFATGTGSDAVPGVLAVEGELTPSDIGRAFQG